MSAWYASSPSAKGAQTRGAEIVEQGGSLDYPAIRHAGFLIACLEEVGISQEGFAGPVKLSSQELKAWVEATGTELGCFDFQDILNASRWFVRAFSMYSNQDIDPPWTPGMSAEEEAKLLADQEARMDRLMGIS